MATREEKIAAADRAASDAYKAVQAVEETRQILFDNWEAAEVAYIKIKETAVDDE